MTKPAAGLMRRLLKKIKGKGKKKMPTTTLRSTKPRPTGLVRVWNRDGSFNREFVITADQLQTLQASGNGTPPGVTVEEWTEKAVNGRPRCVVLGEELEVGSVLERPDGSVYIMYAETMELGQRVRSWIGLEAGEWSGTPPNITADPTALLNINYQDTKIHQGKRRTIESIVAGVVTWQ